MLNPRPLEKHCELFTARLETTLLLETEPQAIQHDIVFPFPLLFILVFISTIADDDMDDDDDDDDDDNDDDKDEEEGEEKVKDDDDDDDDDDDPIETNEPSKINEWPITSLLLLLLLILLSSSRRRRICCFSPPPQSLVHPLPNNALWLLLLFLKEKVIFN